MKTTSLRKLASDRKMTMRRAAVEVLAAAVMDTIPKPARVRMAETRARRRASGLCEECGAPAAVRVIETADGREIERRTLTQCENCRQSDKPSASSHRGRRGPVDSSTPTA